MTPSPILAVNQGVYDGFLAADLAGRDFMAQFSAGRFPGCGGKSAPDFGFAVGAFFGLCRTATMRKIIEKHDKPLEKEAEKVVSFFFGGSGVLV